MRKDLVITRKYGVLTRKDLVLTRKYLVLKRKGYNDIIEWKKYYVWAVLRHRNFTLKIFENYYFFYEDWTN